MITIIIECIFFFLSILLNRLMFYGLSNEKKCRLLFPKEVFSKALFLLFFCIGNIIDAFNRETNENRILQDLKIKGYVFKESAKQVFKFVLEDDKTVKLINEKSKLTNSIPIQSFIKDFLSGVYKSTDEKSYKSKKTRYSSEQEEFFEKVICEIQKTFLGQSERKAISFDALELDDIYYFHPNRSVLKEIDSMSVNFIKCSQIFPYNFWIPQADGKKPITEPSIKSTNHGRIFIQYFNYEHLFFKNAKGNKIILDLEDVSIYKDERMEIEEKLNNFIQENKHSDIVFHDSIPSFLNRDTKLDSNIPSILFSKEHFRFADRFFIPTKEGILRNFAKTELEIIELQDDPFSKVYSLIWSNSKRNKFSDEENNNFKNQFIYPYYQSLFFLEDSKSKGQFEKVIEMLMENSILKYHSNEILELLNYTQNPKLNIIADKIKQYQFNSKRIAVVGTQQSNLFLTDYFRKEIGDLPISFLTKGQILRENNFDVIFVTGYLSNMLSDLYYGGFAERIYIFLYPHEKRILEKNLLEEQKEQIHKMTYQNMKYIFNNSNIFKIEKQIIEKNFEEEIQEKENLIIRNGIRNNKEELSQDDIFISAIPIYFSDDKYRLFTEEGNSRILIYNK